MIRIILALAAVTLALGGLSIGKTAEEGRLRKIITDQRACDAAVFGTDLSASLARCPAATAAVHAEAQRAGVCDQALLAGELFVMRTSCSTEVKTLFANRQAETQRADALAEVLADERADRGAAITRAETRARSETERKLRAEAALSEAPRRGDRLVLDAERLRQLGGEPAAD